MANLEVGNVNGSDTELLARIERQMFIRFWKWIGAMSALIIAFGGVVWAFSLHQLEQYAKNYALNKISEEIVNTRKILNEEIISIRSQLIASTDAATRIMGDSRQQLGSAIEVTANAKKIATDAETELARVRRVATEVEHELVRTQQALKSAGDVTELTQRVNLTIGEALNNANFQNIVLNRVLNVFNGVVVATVSGRCPEHWTNFDAAEGRVIVGLRSGNRSGLIGGKRSVSLSIDELPPHDHDVYWHAGYHRSGNSEPPPPGAVQGAGAGDTVTHVQPGKTSTSGLGRPFETMPPYIELTYCIRRQ